MDSYSNSHLHSNGYLDSHSDGDTHLDSHPNSYPHGDTNFYTDEYAFSHCASQNLLASGDEELGAPTAV